MFLLAILCLRFLNYAEQLRSLEEKKDSNGKGGTTMSPTLNIADQLIRISNVFTPGAAIKTKEFFYW